jgi:hypothetical protein
MESELQTWSLLVALTHLNRFHGIFGVTVEEISRLDCHNLLSLYASETLLII